MGEYAEVLHHVEPPDYVGVGLAVVLLIGHALVAGREAAGAGANQFASIAHVPEPVALNVGAGTEAFILPIVDATAEQFVADRLPEELAVGLVEAHQDLSLIHISEPTSQA